MPRYFFHLKDHTEKLLDPQGRVIDSFEDVPRVALNEARAIVADEALSGVINLNQRIEVEDQNGTIVHSLPFEEVVQIKR